MPAARKLNRTKTRQRQPITKEQSPKRSEITDCDKTALQIDNDYEKDGYASRRDQ